MLWVAADRSELRDPPKSESVDLKELLPKCRLSVRLQGEENEGFEGSAGFLRADAASEPVTAKKTMIR